MRCAAEFALAPGVHIHVSVNRKLALLIAAIVLPGGFIALFGVIFLKALSQTERGRRVVALAQKRMASFGVAAPSDNRQAA